MGARHLDTETLTARIHTRAADLKQALITLDILKMEGGHTRTERLQQPHPGPSAPARDDPMHLKLDIEWCLHEICTDARTTIDTHRSLYRDGPALCDWIMYQANILAHLEWAHDFADSLEHFLHLARKCIGIEPAQPPHVEPRQYAPAICQRLAGMGHRVTPDTLRAWASRSHTTPAIITTEQKGTKNTYLLTEVLDFIQWRNDQRQPTSA